MRRGTAEIKKKIETSKGITLIVLVITIIVLLILAGISIETLTGENGIITKTIKAKEETKKAEYKEELEMMRPGLEVRKHMEKLTTKQLMDEYEKLIKEHPTFQKENTQIIRKEEGKIIVITPEGYVYEITMNGVKYIGKQGENKQPDLEESDIKIDYEPSDWTQGEVKVKITTEIEGYSIQYSFDGKTNWTEYKEELIFKDNGEFFARLVNNLEEVGVTAAGNVANIDRLPPNTFTPTATSTTNSITLTGSTTDAPKTETNGSSGIREYFFSNDNGSTWKQNTNKLQTSYTFNGLTQNKAYSLKMKAVDNAGNEIITSTVSKKTETVEGLDSSNVTFTYNPTTPTKGSVKVGITTTITGYTLRYSKDGKTWTNYTSEVTMTDNGDIYAQLWDGTNAGAYATGNVANIDRLPPNTFTPTATSTTKSITLTGSTTDAPKTATNGSSGIREYFFSNDNGSTWKQNTNKLQTSYTFNGLTQNKAYSLKMKAVDNAGNERITATVSKTTGTVSTATGASYTPTTWTKGNVTVTLPTKSGYTTRYTINGTAPTKTSTQYTAPFAVSSNCVINYCYSDGTNIGEYGTANITNIDKTAPTISSISVGSQTGSSAKLTVTASDNQGGSGIASYKYYLDGTLKTTITTNSYNYTGLSLGTHTLKVVVTDKVNYTAEKSTTVTIVKTINDLKAGEKIYYIDKAGTKRTCIVLYDKTYNDTNKKNYGVQIITANTVGNVTLGNGSGNTDNATLFNTARSSYNNQITTLNNAAMGYLNTTYASDARCVGSVPNNKNAGATTYYTRNENWFAAHNNTFKNGDTNYTADWNQMGPNKLKIHNIGKYYWLASHEVWAQPTFTGFYARCVGDYTGNFDVLYSFILCCVYSDKNPHSDTYTYGLRPVFTLKSTIKITAGNGSTTPYTLTP